MLSFSTSHAPLRTGKWLGVTMLVIIYGWLWAVISHRIGEAPSHAAFVGTFITGCGDFEHFYLAAKALREGADIYLSGVQGYIYPPLIAFAFIPLTFVSVQSAAWFMLVVNMTLGLVCTWAICTEVMRRLDIEASTERVIVVMALTTLLAATKLRSEFQMWQTNILLIAALVFALRFLDKRPRLAGLLLGLAFNIKYLPILFLPYLLLRRRFTAAAWFLIGIATFALLPALQSGLNENAREWSVALSGIANLLGMGSGVVEAANVNAITIGHSISITSGVSRMMLNVAAPSTALLVVAGIALVSGLVFAQVYVRDGKPLIAWPDASRQALQPFKGMVALEWGALVALILAFSPQTNPRHTSLLLISFAPLAAMLCFPKQGVSRWPAFAAAAILFFGLAFPPNTPEFVRQLAWWRDVSGAGWCMLLMLPFYFVAGFQHIDATSSLVSDPATNLAEAWREEYRDEAWRGHGRRLLKRAANVTLAVAFAGIPFAAYNASGYGATVMLGGFAFYLVMMELRARL